MGIFSCKRLIAVLLFLVIFAPVGAIAAEFKTQSSTQYLSYNDPFQDKSQGDLFEYVEFS